MIEILKAHIHGVLTELQKLTPDQLVSTRINKYSSMGVYDTVSLEEAVAEETTKS
jgi:acetyl-CoA carboxylase alpha subunit